MAIALYKDLDIGEVPPTPQDYTQTISDVGNKTLMRYVDEYGYGVGYQQEQNGQIIQNVFPIKRTESAQISSSSRTELALHTETAFHPYKPDLVLLLCLRGDTEALTTYADISDIMSHLKMETVSTLTQTWYLTSIDESFRTHSEPDSDILMPVFTRAGGTTTMVYDQALMKGLNPRATEALDELRTAIEQCTHSIVLEKGDLLVLDNHLTIHGRRPFLPKFDGTDRWLKRCLVVRTLPPEKFRDGNVVTMTFPNNYRREQSLLSLDVSNS